MTTCFIKNFSLLLDAVIGFPLGIKGQLKINSYSYQYSIRRIRQLCILAYNTEKNAVVDDMNETVKTLVMSILGERHPDATMFRLCQVPVFSTRTWNNRCSDRQGVGAAASRIRILNQGSLMISFANHQFARSTTPHMLLIVKLGTSTLTSGTPNLSPPLMVDLARQVAQLQTAGPCSVWVFDPVKS